jgi:molybdopterin synthase catalytic subunit
MRAEESDTMQVHVRLFASYREAVGARELDLELPEGATAEQVIERLAAQYPRFAGLATRAMVARNREYVRRDAPLAPGDEVALIPPVSGGADGAAPAIDPALKPFHITTEPLDAARLAAAVQTDEDGAVLTFIGVVRDSNRGKPVSYLEYEAYPEMAEAKLREIAEEIKARWGVERIVMWHRVGRLEIGEASVVIAVASPHRAEAFAACRHAIERLKAEVPIWKKEVGPDGAEWLEGPGQAPSG